MAGRVPEVRRAVCRGSWWTGREQHIGRLAGEAQVLQTKAPFY